MILQKLPDIILFIYENKINIKIAFIGRGKEGGLAQET